jgi:hypothetical protein
MSYVFLKVSDRHEHRQNPTWFAVSEGRIETISVSNSYDQYGQNISASDAGDYLELASQKAVDLANEIDQNYGDVEYENDRPVRFTLLDCVTAYDDHDIFQKVIESLEEGVDYKLEETMFAGFNYHDGNNWQTISVDSIDDNHSHEIEDDEEMIARLNAALENAEFETAGVGTETHRHEDAVVTYSQFQCAWEYATITFDEQD